MDWCFCIVKGRRYRYICFSYDLTDTAATFRDISEVFHQHLRKNECLSFPKRVRLIQFNDRLGIVRCAHIDVPRVKEIINALLLKKNGEKTMFSTIGCSGTLRAVRQKYGFLKSR